MENQVGMIKSTWDLSFVGHKTVGFLSPLFAQSKQQIQQHKSFLYVDGDRKTTGREK